MQVAALWCQVYRTHKHSITGMNNFSRAWIIGSNNQKTSNIVDHATREQHHPAIGSSSQYDMDN